MAVLARDFQAYQDALEQYQRQVGSYNRNTLAYNESLVTDANGNIYITDGSKVFAIDPTTGRGPEARLPSGLQLNQLGRTALPDDTKYSFLRQNPTELKTEQVTATYKPGFFAQPGGYYLNDQPIDTKQYRLVQEFAPQQIPNPYYNPRLGILAGPQYTLGPKTALYERDASIYPDAPGQQPELKYKAPDPTNAQLRKLASGSGVADPEAGLAGGLIGDVIKGNGLKVSSPRRARSAPSVAPVQEES